MIGLSAPTYDPSGAIVLRVRSSNTYTSARRGSVTATLDGGASAYDTGYSVSDQTLRATLRGPSALQIASLRYLVAYYGEVIACTEAGAYRAVLSFEHSGDMLSITLRLLSRLDA